MSNQPFLVLFRPGICIFIDSDLQIVFLFVLFRKIKANYRRDYPQRSRTFGDFLFMPVYKVPALFDKLIPEFIINFFTTSPLFSIQGLPQNRIYWI